MEATNQFNILDLVDRVTEELWTEVHNIIKEVMNRVKGLDLVDRVTEELWTEVCNIVQEAVTKTIPKGKKKAMQEGNVVV